MFSTVLLFVCQYLGDRVSERVKSKVVVMLYSWTVSLPHEAKIGEAYQMLKTQGERRSHQTVDCRSFKHNTAPLCLRHCFSRPRDLRRCHVNTIASAAPQEPRV